MSDSDTMQQVVDAYKAELVRQDKSPATISNYANDVHLFSRWIEQTYGSFNVDRVVQRDIIEYRGYLLGVQNASAATVNRRIASLSSFFRWRTSVKGKRRANPCDGVKTVAARDPAPRALDTKSLRRLLREVHVHGSTRDIAILEVLCGTALRVGELISLSLRDVEFSDRKGLLHVRHGKGRTARSVPVNVDVRKALAAWLAVRTSSPSTCLFLGQRGEHMTPSGIWRIVKKYARLGNLPELRVHDLRHTVLTRLVREFGADLATVMRISGHRNVKTLMRYVEPTEEEMASAVERLAFTSD